LAAATADRHGQDGAHGGGVAGVKRVTVMIERALVYAYVVLFGLSLLMEHPVPLAIAP
jgi:hypothetical protein